MSTPRSAPPLHGLIGQVISQFWASVSVLWIHWEARVLQIQRWKRVRSGTDSYQQLQREISVNSTAWPWVPTGKMEGFKELLYSQFIWSSSLGRGGGIGNMSSVWNKAVWSKCLLRPLAPKCGDYQEGLGQSRCKNNGWSCCYVWGWLAEKLKLGHLIWKILFPQFWSRELHFLDLVSRAAMRNKWDSDWEWSTHGPTKQNHLPLGLIWENIPLPHLPTVGTRLLCGIFFLYNTEMHSVEVVLGILNLNLFLG